VIIIFKCEYKTIQITLQPTCKRDDTEEPGESGGNSGGLDVIDIIFLILIIHLK